MSPERVSRLSRRHFLAGTGVLAGAVALGACGGGDDDPEAKGPDTTSSEYVLAQFFGSGQFAAGEPIRAPFGVADSQGVLTPALAPAKVELGIYDANDRKVGPTLTSVRRSEGLPRPYFTVETTLPEPGIYTVKAESGVAAGNSMAMEVADPKDLRVVRPGQAMPALETPTPVDARGVNPICTRTPQACPLHDITVAQALQEGKPLALVVASPYFCKVSICGPVLDLVLGRVEQHPGIRFLHAEVYSDPYNDPQLVNYAPILSALQLPLEPVLYLVGTDGVVRQRLDSIFDTSELDAALGKLAS